MNFLNPQDPHGGWSAWDYARRICQLLGDIKDAVSDGDTHDVHPLHRPFIIQTDGSGNGQVSLRLHPGHTLNLLTYAFQIPFPTTASGYVAFYRNDQEDGTNLIEAASAATVFSNNFNAEGHFIPAQSTLLVVARGVAPNVVVAGNLSARSTSPGDPRPSDDSGEF